MSVLILVTNIIKAINKKQRWPAAVIIYYKHCNIEKRTKAFSTVW